MPAAKKRPTSGRILIVDDNALGLVARKSVLKELGHEIATSSAPERALELCATQKFDLIVTDFKMPDMNGIEFIRKLRAQQCSLPIILISGFTDTLGLSAHNTGADAVIQKGSNEVAHLIQAVSRLLRGPVRKPAGSQKSGNRGSAAKKRGTE